MRYPAALLACAAILVVVGAVKIPIVRQSSQNVGFRANQFESAMPAPTGPGRMNNIRDKWYTLNVTVCDESFPVVLDTGSSDLWVTKAPSCVHTTELEAHISYGSAGGQVTGNVATGQVSFGEYSIPKQALINPTSIKGDTNEYKGVLGLGFDSFSQVHGAVVKADQSATWGRSVLMNIFDASPKLPKYITFFLDRAGDLDTVSTGSFTIGEMEDKHSGVLDQRRVNVFPEGNPRRWTVPLDGIKIAGNNFPIDSSVDTAPPGKTIAWLDTGFSLGFGPRTAVERIYRSINGTYDKQRKEWVVPCLIGADVKFVFNQTEYSVHPLDLTRVDLTSKPPVCIGNILGWESGYTDWVLGDIFLRSVYSMFSFGEVETNGKMGLPFVKLLSLLPSDRKAVLAEFEAVRRATLDKLPPKIPTSGNPITFAHPVTEGSGSKYAGGLDAQRDGLRKQQSLVL